MVGRKAIRTRGKLQFSRYFQELKEGDVVSVIREPSVNFSFPKRLQGRTGVIEGKRGRAYIIKIRDQTMNKLFIIPPIHLKKIKTIEKK